MSVKRKINFIDGKPYILIFFSNVDNTITKLKFTNGFSIEEISYKDFIALIENLPDTEMNPVKDIASPRLSTVSSKGYLYFLKTDLDNFKRYDKFSTHLYNLLILLKESDITTPAHIQHAYFKNNKMTQAINILRDLTVQSRRNTLTLKQNEIIEINKMIGDFEFPLFDYLTLAIDNLKASRRAENKEIAFLMLMMGFESLFNNSTVQITYTISRHTAILNAKNEDDFDVLYGKIKKYYTKRSQIVHSNSSRTKPIHIKEIELIELRNLLRESIKKIYYLHLTKKELFKYLNKKGFPVDTDKSQY